MRLGRVNGVLVPAALLFFACSPREEAPQVYSRALLGVPARVSVYSSGETGKELAGKILNEWARIENDFSLAKPYSYMAHINEKAYLSPVRVSGELFYLLELSMYYWKITDGAFDITFAPLWPIWKKAASTGELPSDEDIRGAIENIGSKYVVLDKEKKTVRFTRPVGINIAGILRAYCLARGYEILRASGIDYRVELKLGGYVLAYGERNWKYPVYDPFREGKILGYFKYDEGVVVSSSGRDHFVKIGGKTYSHILDIKTGYPIRNFSNLIVYFENIESENFIPSVVLSLMGREKAFETLSKSKTSAGLWIDGEGNLFLHQTPQSGAKWEKAKKFPFF